VENVSPFYLADKKYVLDEMRKVQADLQGSPLTEEEIQNEVKAV
jgi:hypothetical protein